MLDTSTLPTGADPVRTILERIAALESTLPGEMAGAALSRFHRKYGMSGNLAFGPLQKRASGLPGPSLESGS